MRVLLLGPLTVVDGDTERPVRSARQGAVLATLALHVGQVCPRSRLVDAVWGGKAPATARNALQVHVSALRRLLGATALHTVGDGYRLDLPGQEVDVIRFADLVRLGSVALADGQHAEAARLLRSALALWRGEPFEELGTPLFEAEWERLRQLRLAATLARLDADLALGRHLMVVEELAALATDHPYDEGVAARRMLALYRSGRQAEALQVYDTMLRLLRRELGIDTGPALRTLHQQVLRQESDLEREPTTSGTAWRIPIEPGSGGLVGREALLTRLQSRLPDAKVHTLVGPSGVGKTRLATELGIRCQFHFPGGAVLVRAAGVTGLDPLLDLLLEAVDAGHDPPAGGKGRRQLLTRAEALIVLDDLDPDPSLRASLAELVAESAATFVVTAPRPTGIPGEQITSVPPLAPDQAAELLLARATASGAELDTADEATRRLAVRCAELVDGFPIAIELMAPFAVTGLADLLAMLSRWDQGRGHDPLRVSFESSLDRLGDTEIALVDLLCSAGGGVDAEVLVAAGLDSVVAPLVRDGLVRRELGPHGAALYAVVSHVGRHVLETRDEERDRRSARVMLQALAEVAGTPRQFLPMMIPCSDRARMLVAMEPVLTRAVADAATRELDPELLEAAVRLALLLPELHFSRYGVAPPPGRGRWLIEHPQLPAPRRVDLLLGLAMELGYDQRRDAALQALSEALTLAEDLRDPGRLAQVLANRVAVRLMTGAAADEVEDDARAAIRAAEAAGGDDVLAGTLTLLYPHRDSPPDLADAMQRAAHHARLSGHRGLLFLGLANLAFWELDCGRAAHAEVHAREAQVIAEANQNRGALTAAAALADSAHAQAGGTTLAAIVSQLELAWARPELRTVTDGLLRLAAGTRARDEGLARRFLGAYDAVLVAGGLSATASEETFVETWLADLVPAPAARPLAELLPALIRDVRALSDRAG
jgi:DNA-binding SARP family transcriptional activator